MDLKTCHPDLIPEIAKKIETVLNYLELKPKISPEEFIEKTACKKHRYSSICLTSNKDRVMFYALLYGIPADKERMKTEIFIANELKKRGRISFLPQYFDANIGRDLTWLTREYLPANSLESRKEIEKLAKKLSAKNILAIINSAYNLSHSFLSRLSFLKKFDIKNYLNLGSEKSISLLLKEKVLNNTEAIELCQLLNKNEKLLEKENCYFSHGDFHIGNIILNKEGVKIIDLESAQINNFAFDIAFLFCRLWKEQKTREKIVKNYFKLLNLREKRVFPSLFRIDVFFTTYNSFLDKPFELTKKQVKKRRRELKKTMKNAIDSFEELIKI